MKNTSTVPPLASCPHCGTIVLRTSRMLVHPTPGERERVREALGSYWFHHARTKLDGRLHHCPAGPRQVPSAGL